MATRRTRVRGEALPGGGARGRLQARDGPKTQRRGPAMDELAEKSTGKRKTKGKQSNGDGFMKRSIPRHRGRRDLPCGGGGRRRNMTVWMEKLA